MEIFFPYGKWKKWKYRETEKNYREQDLRYIKNILRKNYNYNKRRVGFLPNISRLFCSNFCQAFQDSFSGKLANLIFSSHVL